MQKNADLIVLENLNNRLSEFLELLKSEKYYEAHELLEEPWREGRAQKLPLSLLLKALINAAVALFHQNRGNTSGAIKCKDTYQKYRNLEESLNEAELSVFASVLSKTDELLQKIP